MHDPGYCHPAAPHVEIAKLLVFEPARFMVTDLAAETLGSEFADDGGSDLKRIANDTVGSYFGRVGAIQRM